MVEIGAAKRDRMSRTRTVSFLFASVHLLYSNNNYQVKMPAIFAHPPFLAECDSQDSALLTSAARVAPLIVEASQLESGHGTPNFLPASCEYWVKLTAEGQTTEDQAIKILDNGATKIITKDASLASSSIPAERILLWVDSTTSTPLSDSDLMKDIAGLYVDDLPEAQASQLLASFREVLGGKRSIDSKILIFRPTSGSVQDATMLGKMEFKAVPSLPTSKLNPSSLSTLFTSVLKTDRTDGLFATSVTSSSGDSLGLVYSSNASVAMSIESGAATYYSRSRNSLWKKGETSGATQLVNRIRIDCDGDALEFEVAQKQGTGFCQ